MKTNNLKLVEEFYDKEKTKPHYQYFMDEFGVKQGEYKFWYKNGQIFCIYNYKDGVYHGKCQDWWWGGIRWYIDTRHFKKKLHGTKIYFDYEQYENK